jgi:hypothetical protein
MPGSPTQSTEVPEEAVETAARALVAAQAGDPFPLVWDDGKGRLLSDGEKHAWRQEAREALQAAAPALRKQGADQERQRLINDPVRVSFCNACGYVDEPRRTACANCGGQMQRISKSLVDLAAQSERQRLKEALLSEDVRREIADIAANNGDAEDIARLVRTLLADRFAALDTLGADRGPGTAPGAAVEETMEERAQEADHG